FHSAVLAAPSHSIMQKQRLAPAKWTICWCESITTFIPRSLLKYSSMSRCCRFFVSPRREESAYPSRGGGITDEQRRRGEKAAQPGGRKPFGLSGDVARFSQVTAYMLVTRALPSSPKRSRAAWLITSTGS